MKNLAVVGGGVSGLAAAYYLEKLSPPDCEITLFERASRVGGVISSPLEDGFRYEEGPDSFLSYKQAALDLVEELGITDRLVNSNTRSVYVVKNGRLENFPAGFQFFVPTGWAPLARTKLFSWGTKLRVAREAFRRHPETRGDLSVGDFARSRFGEEVARYLAEPLISGIYGGDADALSMNAVLPQFLEYEKQYGNAIRGVIRAAQSNTRGKPKWAPFVSFQSGMQELTDAIAGKLARTRLRLGESVEEIASTSDGVRVQGEPFDAAICAMPPAQSQALARGGARCRGDSWRDSLRVDRDGLAVLSRKRFAGVRRRLRIRRAARGESQDSGVLVALSQVSEPRANGIHLRPRVFARTP